MLADVGCSVRKVSSDARQGWTQHHYTSNEKKD